MYLPFLKDQQFLYMGLNRLPPVQWIEPDDLWPTVYAHKQSVLAKRYSQVVAALPESLPAQAELKQCLQQHLLCDHAETFALQDACLCHTPSQTLITNDGLSDIDQVGRWISDDVCIMQASDSGYRLTAASLCSPSFWHLEDKIGQALDDIHAPLPGYAGSRLAHSMNRFFDRLKVDAPVWRANWSINAHSGLLQRLDPPNCFDADSDSLLLRVERQTLRRLPETNAICFTIRIYQYPLDQVVAEPEARSALSAALSNLSDSERHYKSLAPFADRVAQMIAEA